MRTAALVASVFGALLGYQVAAAADRVPAQPEAAAVFAGGCFWCMEPPFDALPGVISTTSGYTGGDKARPAYEEVSAGGTGHAEAVRVVYDPAKVSYARLLDVYWRNIDPLDAGGQFCDRGSQYRSAIFWLDEAQRQAAQRSKEAVARILARPIATEIVQAGEFWPAEDYHQDYYRHNPVRYKFYRYSCGRDRRLAEVWEGRPALALAPPR